MDHVLPQLRSSVALRTNLQLATLVLVFLCLWASPIEADKPSGSQSSMVKMPGVEINLKQKCIDLEATVCLQEGFLELVACAKGSKEHESLVAVTARPMHIHTALLLLGAKNGNPAMRRLVGEKEKRWVNVAPRGDPIQVTLVCTDKDGNPQERSLSDFIAKAGAADPEPATSGTTGRDTSAKDDEKFPHSFVFAGSQLREQGTGPRQYLADGSGHVISIATFGDELLCLTEYQSHKNGMLTWQVNAKDLPKVGTKIILRLRPKKTKQQ